MKSFFALFLVVLFFSCSDNSNQNENCRFLLDIGINENVRLNLLPGSNLSSGTSVLIESSLHRGIIVTQVGSTYYAWDAADPNHTFDGSCKLKPTNNTNTFGLTATCSCEDKNEFSLVNGLPLINSELRCSLRNYRVEQSGNTLLISN